MRKDCWAWGQRVSRDRARPCYRSPPDHVDLVSFSTIQALLAGSSFTFFWLDSRLHPERGGGSFYEGRRCEGELAAIADNHVCKEVYSGPGFCSMGRLLLFRGWFLFRLRVYFSSSVWWIQVYKLSKISKNSSKRWSYWGASGRLY